MNHVDIKNVVSAPEVDGRRGSVIYLVDSADHPGDPLPLAGGSDVAVVRVPVRDWGASLTPWPAPSPWRGQPDFGGRADETLAELAEALPRIEAKRGLSPARRAVCGYSLAGLFSLYAFVRTDLFRACGCVSGSVWYEGWVPWLQGRDLDLEGRFAHLSVGSREKNARQPILRGVEDDMAACASILRGYGCEVECTVGPGTHFQHEQERIAAAVASIGRHLSAE